ncbi:hypothetical protein DPMN_018620 [Dreissena polymorpha]|uniref:Uncharacterized protein n=1 Tax=Dreissena polymorpha TaxID=45954 RepID=A0A9D4S8J1_DREPO|nr:hypothetical protein DPMN_018620 [Dreissena polymorpha]
MSGQIISYRDAGTKGPKAGLSRRDRDVWHINILTKFHKDWMKTATSIVYTNKLLTDARTHKEHRISHGHIRSPCHFVTDCDSHVFQPTGIIFEIFHEDQTINVASRVKNAPYLCGHVFQVNISIFKLNRHIQKTHVLAKFPEDWTKDVTFRVFTLTYRETALPPGGHVFSSIWTIFKLVPDINRTNVSTKFHDDWAKIVNSRVFTRNTAPPTGGNLHEDLASNVTSTVFTSFELSLGINGTSVLTKFHEDRTIKASRVFTRQNVDDARRTTDKKRFQKLTMSMLCSGELKRNMTARQ